MDPIMKSRDPVGRRGALSEAARLLPYAKAYRGLFLLTFLWTVGLAVVDVPIPFFLKRVIDAVLRHHESLPFFHVEVPPQQFLFSIFLSLCVIALAKGFLIYLQRISSETMGQRMVY